MILRILNKIFKNEPIEPFEIEAAIDEMTTGEASEIKVSALLTALKLKGETVSDITAAANALRKKCIPVKIDTKNVIDLVGTGGDCKNTFNITTAAAFCAAGAGCKIAKHGNRSATSNAGAADILEAFGADINTSPEKCLLIFNKTGICFMFAQNHNPCMKYVSRVRSEIGFRTLFNILGPLLNPANVKMQLIGVYNEELCRKLAEVLVNLGITSGMTVYGKDGLDEATITTNTLISEIKNRKICTYEISPSNFGIKKALISDIQGGSVKDNVQIIKDIFDGKDKGPKYDIVALNAALALYITKKVSSIKDGIDLAKMSINNGFAKKKLEDYIFLTNNI